MLHLGAVFENTQITFQQFWHKRRISSPCNIQVTSMAMTDLLKQIMTWRDHAVCAEFVLETCVFKFIIVRLPNIMNFVLLRFNDNLFIAQTIFCHNFQKCS